MSVNKRQANGALIPIAGLGTYSNNDLKQYATLPTASPDNEGMIVQYSGTDSTNYSIGGIYQCRLVDDTYTWVLLSQVELEAGSEIDISGNVISTKIFVGTTAAWTAETNKSKYNLVVLTDE